MRQREIEPVRLGSAGLVSSRVGIGTWAIGGGWGPQPEEVSLQALHRALEMGCKLIDTAALYGNGRAERLIARAFKARTACDHADENLSTELPLGTGPGNPHNRDLPT